jgi:hypothetical protein
MEASGQLHAPAALPPWEKAPGAHWIGGWMGPRAGVDAEEKGKISCPCWESNPVSLAVKPISRRYGD